MLIKAYQFCEQVRPPERRSVARCVLSKPEVTHLFHALLRAALTIFPMSLILYLLRHGQTELSREDNFCGAGLDPELTEHGWEMAAAFAEAYKATAWSAIYSSHQRRSVATAKLMSEAVGKRMEVREGLREIAYGQWEGLTKEQVSKDYQDDYVNWLSDPAWNAPTEGEFAVSIARRALRVIEDIKQQYAHGNVLVVSHKATIRIVLCSLLGIDLGRFRYRLVCPVGSVSVVEFTSHGALLRVLADRSHLSPQLLSLPGT
jgi:broad specificity phosphatase PhoE